MQENAGDDGYWTGGTQGQREGSKTGGIQDRRDTGHGEMQERDAGQYVCKTGGMLGMRDVRHEGCKAGGMQDRWDARHVGCRTGGMQDRRDARQEGCKTGGMQDRRYLYARPVGCRKVGRFVGAPPTKAYSSVFIT